jgi:hypothetical protein
MLVLAACQGGAAQTPSTSASPSDGGARQRDVDVVDLFVSPAPLDFDGQLGSDGLVARVLFFQWRQSQAVPAQQGRLVLVLFAGSVGPAKLSEGVVLAQWPFEPAALRQLARPSAVGPVYNLALPWRDGRRPPVSLVTLAARYEPAQGQPIWSRPATLSLVAR